MIAFALAAQVTLSGFLVFPAVMGFYAWTRNRPDGLWLAMTALSLVTSVLLFSTAVFLWSDTSAAARDVAFTVRHLSIGAAYLCLVAIVVVLSGRRLLLVNSAIAALIVIRAGLWFFTDLVWTHSFDGQGLPIYGPWHHLLALPLAGLLVGGGLYSALKRPWESEFDRRVFLAALVLGAALGLAASQVSGHLSEYLVALVPLPTVLALQLNYFRTFRHRHRRIQLMGLLHE